MWAWVPTHWQVGMKSLAQLSTSTTSCTSTAKQLPASGIEKLEACTLWTELRCKWQLYHFGFTIISYFKGKSLSVFSIFICASGKETDSINALVKRQLKTNSNGKQSLCHPGNYQLPLTHKRLPPPPASHLRCKSGWIDWKSENAAHILPGRGGEMVSDFNIFKFC